MTTYISEPPTLDGISRPPSPREYLADRVVTAFAYPGAAAVILLVAYILWEIGARAAPAIVANGPSFLVDLSWDPQRRIFGILPEIWGTLYSSLAGAGDRRLSSAISIAIFLTQDFLPSPLAVVFRHDRRAAGRDPERGLRPLGHLRASSRDPPGRRLAA